MTYCPDCGMEGCSPTCPGPKEIGFCPQCGGNCAIRDGEPNCEHCKEEARWRGEHY